MGGTCERCEAHASTLVRFYATERVDEVATVQDICSCHYRQYAVAVGQVCLQSSCSARARIRLLALLAAQVVQSGTTSPRDPVVTVPWHDSVCRQKQEAISSFIEKRLDKRRGKYHESA